MSRIKKSSHQKEQGVSTASLPDIVFMILFFFMAVSVMKSIDPLVQYTKPTANTLTRFENTSLMANIRVGKPKGQNAFFIQLDDELVNNERAIARFVQQKQGLLNDWESNHFIAAMEIDQEAKMSLINKIKAQLQDVEQYKVAYLAEAMD